jgi:hypothetical protein
MKRPVHSILAAAAILVLLAARPARAIVYQNASEETAGAGQSFLNGEAKLTISLSDGTTDGCTGSLLAGGGYILTAAHCVTGSTDTAAATNISIDFANVGLNLTATSYIVDPVWNGSVDNGGDLALVKLSTPVTTISGYALDTASSAVGDTVTLAGYGDTGVGSTGYTAGTFGTLYYGTNRFIGTYSTVPSVYDYTFSQYGPAEAMIAPGDSGGAALIDLGGTWEIVGVNDFDACNTNGCTPDSTFGQTGGDTSVYADTAFLESVLAPEPASAAVFGIGMSFLAAVRRRRGVA